MLEELSDEAHDVVAAAQREARTLGHDHVGTEHLLLGLIHDPGLAGEALATMGVSAAAARRALMRVSPSDRRVPGGSLPLTRNARTVLSDAEREANVFGGDAVLPEHMLVALTRVGQGVAVRVLRDLLGDVSRLRVEIVSRIDSPEPTPSVRRDVIDRVDRLEAEVARLRAEVARLTQRPADPEG